MSPTSGRGAVTDDISRQLEASLTPGALLKAAREAQGLPEKEVADRLHLMPGYVSILEQDDYQALRSPAFARGYVKAYGRLLGLDEGRLLAAFDRLRASQQVEVEPQADTRPPQLQRTGLGVVVSLAFLLVLVLALWWWHGQGPTEGQPDPVSPVPGDTGQAAAGADNPAGEP